MEKIQNFEIREAVVEDIPLILSFIKELAEYEKLSHIVVATEELLEKSLFSEESNSEVILAYLQGQPVGFALYFYNFSTFLGKKGIYLEDLYVNPETRGKGIGKALLIRLAQIANENDCGRLEWSVLDWNESAIDFYKRLGAVPMDEWTVFRLNEKEIETLANS